MTKILSSTNAKLSNLLSVMVQGLTDMVL